MLEKVPQQLKDLEQWILWRYVGDDRRKTPFQPDGSHAKANDPSTWRTFEVCARSFNVKRDAGLGFEFSADDPFVGIDLDNCRENGETKVWAKEVIKRFDTYTEVSPSGNGFKLWCAGDSPFKTGKRIVIEEPERIEIYSTGRYFAVTGQRVAGVSKNVETRTASLEWLQEKYAKDEAIDHDVPPLWDDDQTVLERARLYVDRIPGAVAGQGGHNATYHVACVLVRGFMLSRSAALTLFAEWNQRCEPSWSDRDLQHKIEDADKAPGPRGSLRDAAPATVSRISLPTYPQPKVPQGRFSTLSGATAKVLKKVVSGEDTLTPLGLPDLDDAIGGGVEPGEMVVLAARPSHGKTAAALNIVHFHTAMKRTCMFVSLEMSKHAIGKRALQYMTTLPERSWRNDPQQLARDRDKYFETRAECYLIENCVDPAELTRHVESYVDDHGVELVCVDYAQLMHGKGKSKYEQISNVSSSLRQLANKTGIILVALCQLNREIESRKRFIPALSDIRDSGQIEQDADVLVFLVWPHRVSETEDPSKFQFYVAKNRNREIKHRVVECCFNAAQQKLYYAAAEYETKTETV